MTPLRLRYVYLRIPPPVFLQHWLRRTIPLPFMTRFLFHLWVRSTFLPLRYARVFHLLRLRCVRLPHRFADLFYQRFVCFLPTPFVCVPAAALLSVRLSGTACFATIHFATGAFYAGCPRFCVCLPVGGVCWRHVSTAYTVAAMPFRSSRASAVFDHLRLHTRCTYLIT